MRNETLLLQARPVLALDTQLTGEDEHFQNETLRPILKLQHDLLLAVYQTQIEKRMFEQNQTNQKKQNV